MVPIDRHGKRHIGLDVGTTSVSCAVIETMPGRVLAVVSRPHRGEIESSSPVENLQDPDLILRVARDLLHETLARYGPAGSIGVTGQMHGILYLNEAGGAVSPLYTWLDGRAGQNGPDGRRYVDALQELTGYRIPVGFGAATHFVNLKRAGVPPTARGLCTLPDYVAMHLAGTRRPVTDRTLAHSVGLYDPERGTFDQEAWNGLGGPPLALPSVCGDGVVLGRYSDRSPVCTPLGDNQASFLGSVRQPDRSVLINIGTSGQISYLDELVSKGDPVPVDPTSTLLERRPYPGNRTLYVGASLTAGKALELLASLLDQVLSAGGGVGRRQAYELMEAVTRPPAGPHLRVDTRFAGSRQDPEARGSIQGIDLHNLTLEHLVYGFCHGVVDELHQLWGASHARELAGSALQYLVGGGNALRSNRLLRDRLQEAFALPLYVPAYREEAAVGAAISAAAIVDGCDPDALARGVVQYDAPEGPAGQPSPESALPRSSAR